MRLLLTVNFFFSRVVIYSESAHDNIFSPVMYALVFVCLLVCLSHSSACHTQLIKIIALGQTVI